MSDETKVTPELKAPADVGSDDGLGRGERISKRFLRALEFAFDFEIFEAFPKKKWQQRLLFACCWPLLGLLSVVLFALAGTMTALALPVAAVLVLVAWIRDGETA